MTKPDPALPSTLPWFNALPDPGLLLDPAAGWRVQYANPTVCHLRISLQVLQAFTDLWPEPASQLAAPDAPSLGPPRRQDALDSRDGGLPSIREAVRARNRPALLQPGAAVPRPD